MADWNSVACKTIITISWNGISQITPWVNFVKFRFTNLHTLTQFGINHLAYTEFISKHSKIFSPKHFIYWCKKKSAVGKCSEQFINFCLIVYVYGKTNIISYNKLRSAISPCITPISTAFPTCSETCMILFLNSSDIDGELYCVGILSKWLICINSSPNTDL